MSSSLSSSSLSSSSSSSLSSSLSSSSSSSLASSSLSSSSSSPLLLLLFFLQSVYNNISRVLEVADKLSDAVHYESDRIEALAHSVEREWKTFDMNINQRSCLLARSVAYHKHSEEVRTST